MNQITTQRMTLIFNEWAARYVRDPDSFSTILNSEGKPVESYGEQCARYFNEIADDMDAKGLLPKPIQQP